MEENKRSIHEGHRERLRERYREVGLDHFKDHEILEILLGYTILQKDTNLIAHQLIEQFGDLRGVLEAGEDALAAVKNVGPGTAFFLSMLPDITRRYYEELSDKKIRLVEARQRVEFFLPYFIGRKTEVAYAAFLDETKLLLDCIQLCNGSLNSVPVSSTQLLKAAQKRACRYVVLAHNHFTDPNPSMEDIATTRDARMLLVRAGIGLLDHVVICGTKGMSMVETGHFRLTAPQKE